MFELKNLKQLENWKNGKNIIYLLGIIRNNLV